MLGEDGTLTLDIKPQGLWGPSEPLHIQGAGGTDRQLSKTGVSARRSCETAYNDSSLSQSGHLFKLHEEPRSICSRRRIGEKGTIKNQECDTTILPYHNGSRCVACSQQHICLSLHLTRLSIH